MEPAALDGYVRWGFRDRPDGQVELAVPARGRGVVLRVRHPARRRARVVRAPRVAALPTVTDRRAPTAPTCPAACSPAQAERAGVDLVTVAGTHFFVQEDTARAAALVREHLAW